MGRCYYCRGKYFCLKNCIFSTKCEECGEDFYNKKNWEKNCKCKTRECCATLNNNHHKDWCFNNQNEKKIANLILPNYKHEFYKEEYKYICKNCGIKKDDKKTEYCIGTDLCLHKDKLECEEKIKFYTELLNKTNEKLKKLGNGKIISIKDKIDFYQTLPEEEKKIYGTHISSILKKLGSITNNKIVKIIK